MGEFPVLMTGQVFADWASFFAEPETSACGVNHHDLT